MGDWNNAMSLLMTVIAVLALSACASQPPKTLDQKLQGAKKKQSPEELADMSAEKVTAKTCKSRRGGADHAQRIEKICEAMRTLSRIKLFPVSDGKSSFQRILLSD